MSGQSFDALTKAFGNKMTRRHAIKSILYGSGATVLAVVAGTAGSTIGAEAFNCPPGQGFIKCTKSGPCCNTDLGEVCCGSVCCSSGQTCCGGTVCCSTTTQKCCTTSRGNLCCAQSQNCTPAGCTGKAA